MRNFKDPDNPEFNVIKEFSVQAKPSLPKGGWRDEVVTGGYYSICAFTTEPRKADNMKKVDVTFEMVGREVNTTEEKHYI